MVSWLVGGLVGLIEVHGSWLMTDKSLVSIAPLIGKKFEDIGGAGGGGGAAAVGQVTAEVPLNFGGSALTNCISYLAERFSNLI